MTLSVALLCALVFVMRSYAQPYLYIGAHAGWGGSWYSTTQDIRAIDGSGCGQFTNGNGNGFTGGLGAEVELLPWLRGGARLTYARYGGVLKSTCDNGFIVPVGNNQFVPLVREYTRTVTLDYGLLQLGFKVLPFEFPLFFTAGVDVGAPIFAASWTQDERIVSPSGALFPDYTVRRSNGGGTYENTQLRTALNAGIGWALPLRGNAELSPSIAYAHPLTTAVTGSNWKIANLSAGVGLAWRFDLKPAPPPPPLPPPPTPPPPPPPPAAPTAHLGTTTDASVHITETFVTETFPILPYIFFGKNSDTIPAKYAHLTKDGAAAFVEKDLPRKTLDIYYHLLDIIGRRLHDDPSITVTLIGSTDDRDVEEGNTTLARGRAEAVRSYLTDMWGIDKKRLAITTQKLPPIPTSRAYPEGDEENRRVDVTSTSAELFRPVVHERFSEYNITPPTLELSLGADAGAPVESWSLAVQLGGERVASFGDRGAPPATLHWRLTDDVAAHAGATDALKAVLTVTDAHGLSAQQEVEIPIH